MNIIITNLLALAGMIALFFIIAPLFKKKQDVNREIIINEHRQKVFDLLKI